MPNLTVEDAHGEMELRSEYRLVMRSSSGVLMRLLPAMASEFRADRPLAPTENEEEDEEDDDTEEEDAMDWWDERCVDRVLGVMDEDVQAFSGLI
uniref:Uncharacterized protein n=1 Tax=Mycena chlorophos TaxID=658473 RepID=A0ABQ0LYJ7_MYCCL|nr:predicted protein [Mycena chlorophos]